MRTRRVYGSSQTAVKHREGLECVNTSQLFCVIVMTRDSETLPIFLYLV